MSLELLRRVAQAFHGLRFVCASFFVLRKGALDSILDPLLGSSNWLAAIFQKMNRSSVFL